MMKIRSLNCQRDLSLCSDFSLLSQTYFFGVNWEEASSSCWTQNIIWILKSIYETENSITSAYVNGKKKFFSTENISKVLTRNFPVLEWRKLFNETYKSKFGKIAFGTLLPRNIFAGGKSRVNIFLKKIQKNYYTRDSPLIFLYNRNVEGKSCPRIIKTNGLHLKKSFKIQLF